MGQFQEINLTIQEPIYLYYKQDWPFSNLFTFPQILIFILTWCAHYHAAAAASFYKTKKKDVRVLIRHLPDNYVKSRKLKFEGKAADFQEKMGVDIEFCSTPKFFCSVLWKVNCINPNNLSSMSHLQLPSS